MYGKLFASMYDGSLYGNWKAIVTFQQMIVLCGPDGVVDMTPQALAARTSIPLEVITDGIAVLEAPDQYSRSPQEDGRRIERLDDHRPWGWRIVNYRKYRLMVSAEEKREADRVRLAEKRALARMSQGVADSRASSRDVAEVAQAEAEVEVKKKKTKAPAALSADDLEAEGIPLYLAEEWLAVRRDKGAKRLSKLAWEGVKSEAAKAGWSIEDAVHKCVTRNWVSFEARFVADERGPPRTLAEQFVP